ncbi:hypothetical protein RhiirA4_480004 [Rhizophagus irregularis]|uniref:Uncharacterized protein n=1 Tax=Rhizophagus irregularis TaxID=588596 RepID=A0A2I1HH96_9GLOM|nr:hypothetical protein RhiirA4_480004 [Rhizophagus irregularis]
MPVTLKDKEDKTVIRNFICIDNSKIEPIPFLSMPNIQKVQGVPEPNKNQFHIKLYGKTYIIPIYSKVLVVKNLPKEDQKSSYKASLGSQVLANSFNPKKDLKKSVKSLKNAL